MSGQGEAFYQYDKEYRDDKTWTEEIIDKTSFGFQEVGMEIQYRVANRMWLGLTGSFRNTSPVKLIDTPEDLFKGLNAGVTFKYGVY